jgi:hypothetical protein
MANRVMEQKRIKIRRQRRAWAVSFERSGMKTPNRVVINEYKQRAKGLMLDDDISESIIQKFAHDERRRVALEHQAKMELLIEEGLRFKGPGPDNKYEESWVYFNSQRTSFFVIHRDKSLGIERRSILYSCKEILITKWNMGKVTWAEAYELRTR